MIDNFIPEFWASIVLEAAQKAMVYAQPGVINRNYEGEFARRRHCSHNRHRGCNSRRYCRWN